MKGDLEKVRMIECPTCKHQGEEAIFHEVKEFTRCVDCGIIYPEIPKDHISEQEFDALRQAGIGYCSGCDIFFCKKCEKEKTCSYCDETYCSECMPNRTRVCDECREY